MYKSLINLFLLFNISAAYNVVSPKFVQEAEIKHGRVAMLSSLAIPLLDNVEPGVLGVNYVNSLDLNNQQLLLFLFGFSEFCQMLNAYEFPNSTNDWFKMKKEHVPGEYGFDPLNIVMYNNSKSVKTNEMVVGRLAMIAVTCQMANELLVGEPVLKF